jgi:hypothetical protein
MNNGINCEQVLQHAKFSCQLSSGPGLSDTKLALQAVAAFLMRTSSLTFLLPTTFSRVPSTLWTSRASKAGYMLAGLGSRVVGEDEMPKNISMLLSSALVSCMEPWMLDPVLPSSISGADAGGNPCGACSEIEQQLPASVPTTHTLSTWSSGNKESVSNPSL